MTVIIREVLEAEVEVDSVEEAEAKYSNEEVVLDYSNLVSTDFIPEEQEEVDNE